MATATAPSPGATPAPSSASNVATHARGGHKRTVKPKRWSKPCYANGPTASPTQQAPTAREPSPATSAGTTDTDHTAHSVANRRSAASHTSVGPTPSPRNRLLARPRAARRAG
jgi:hypothetical protein